MASSHNVELEAAKFLHKLIQDSTDEPSKLATKLYVILQHMKSSGKEHSMPYQVISRAMETVISRHGLDLESLKSTRFPISGGTQMGDSSSAQCAGSSQGAGVAKDSKVGFSENSLPKVDPCASNRPPAGPSSAAHDCYQGSGTQRSSQSLDHESPSSLDTRSANSQSQDKQMNQSDGKKLSTKRKRGDSSLPLDSHIESLQQLDTRNVVMNAQKGKTNKGSDNNNFNMVPNSGQVEHLPTISSNVRSILISRPEGQNMTGNLVDSTDISNLLVPNSKYPEEVEVSSSHNASGQQQGGSLSAMHDVLCSRALWNQNKAGLPFERSQVHRFSSNVVSGSMAADVPIQQSTHASLVSGAFGKVHGGAIPATSNSNPATELSGSMELNGSEHQKHGLSKGLEHDGGSSNKLADANKIIQVGRQNSALEMPMNRATTARDTGKSSVPQSPIFSGMPFKEQQLKQLRAQCLVFLAFRNGLMPKKLHLEIALGNIFPKEDGPRKELIDNRAKAQSSNEPSSISEAAMPLGRMNNVPLGGLSSGKFPEVESLSKEPEKLKMEDRSGPAPDLSLIVDERKHLLAPRKLDTEIQSQEIMESQAFSTIPLQRHDSASTRSSFSVSNPLDNMENGHQVGHGNPATSVMGTNRQMNSDVINWSGISSHNEVSRAFPAASAFQHELVTERKENIPGQLHGPGDAKLSEFQTRCLSAGSKVVPADDTLRNGALFITGQGEEDKSLSTDSPLSPKYTMSEKWIMDQQKRKLVSDQSWVLKQQKTKQRIVASFNRLKENVSSSEDISAKTKSVIELKKLQLLELQRRLRSDFLNDFFKPITSDMDRLKSYKKHKHGRRIKQLEKYEQKMKEERQKRIRERQKEFFSEIEVHKERLDDMFKIRRERWKGFNKYVKEFHKRKERIHREKIDRIQREKINLLKINDVEGYLRMVQDAKSDRVKQLLKETEKYLQKLGSKLQEAKSMAQHFENDMDEARITSDVENESAFENEDESDQAKHYLESNEKYYMMAHSIKENITEQPSYLHGGKLREYQMNGLRWLVSLYNNHLNGILADEMGLGKTVQVIALICYLMETKNDRGPFLVVVPSSVLPGWESEINFWAPGIHKIVYAGPPEERRKLFKDRIVHQKFNVLLTTYEYLMNKHDRPKLSKVHWHYIIIDEGHRIKNASCKLNADLKHYHSSHRLLLTGTPLQNNLEELWALLNFLLPNIFNSSEDFSQWFNKPFESNGDNSADEALLSEEENLLIINRLHQVLRPFVLRRLKHKVENELPEKIERLIRCEASAYQKLLMKRVEENLGSIGNSKARSVHNTVMELRNICNHPYLSQLHAEEVDSLIPKHFLPPIIRLCGKLEMLDRLLPKLKATDHRVLFFSTMTRLLDIMEEYLSMKQYRYLRLDGHTSGNERGALIEMFNQPNSPYFIFLLSIRAGGVGVNLQAADTVIIFDTDWNPQVDLQAQARAHRIGQKKDVLVLRFETVQTVEEQVRASAEHKLGVANQSITAGFFDNNTSAEDRREYLESLLRECKKEEAAPVLDDDALNDILARSESEIDVFESVDKQRREEEMGTWKKLVWGQGLDNLKPLPPLPSRLVTDDDLKEFYEAMKLFDVPKAGVASNVGVKRKGEYLGGLDTQQYGRGKRAREVRSYEEQWTEEEFEKLCQVDSPESPKLKEEVVEKNLPKDDASAGAVGSKDPCAPSLLLQPPNTAELLQQPPLQSKDATPPSKRGRGRPRRVSSEKSPAATPVPASCVGKIDVSLQKIESNTLVTSAPSSCTDSTLIKGNSGTSPDNTAVVAANLLPRTLCLPATSVAQSTPAGPSVSVQSKGQGRKTQSGGQAPRRRGKRQELVSQAAADGLAGSAPKVSAQLEDEAPNPLESQAIGAHRTTSSVPIASSANPVASDATVECTSKPLHHSESDIPLNSQSAPPPSVAAIPHSSPDCHALQVRSQGRKAQTGVGTPRRRGKKQAQICAVNPDGSSCQDTKLDLQSLERTANLLGNKATALGSNQESDAQEPAIVPQAQLQNINAPVSVADQDQDYVTQLKQSQNSLAAHKGPAVGEIQNADMHVKASVIKGVSSECSSSKVKSGEVCSRQGGIAPEVPVINKTLIEMVDNQGSENKVQTAMSTGKTSVSSAPTDSFSGADALEAANKSMHNPAAKIGPSSETFPACSSVPSAIQSSLCPSESMSCRRQGRKAPNRVDAPRRRGRKPAATDGSSAQDLKLNPLASKAVIMRSRQETNSHESSNLVQAQAPEIHSTGSFVGQDVKKKENSANATFSRIQAADVNDVARVMKEIFSETCSSKAKVSESCGSEGRNALPASSKIPTEAKNQALVDKAYLNSPGQEKVAPFNVPIDKNKGRPEVATDAKELEDAPFVKAPVSGTDSLKPECKSSTGSESTESMEHLKRSANENSVVKCTNSQAPEKEALSYDVLIDKHKEQHEREANAKGEDSAPKNAGHKEGASQMSSPVNDDNTGSNIGASSTLLGSSGPVDPPQLTEDVKNSKESPFKESSLDDNPGDYSSVVSSVSDVTEPYAQDPCKEKKIPDHSDIVNPDCVSNNKSDISSTEAIVVQSYSAEANVLEDADALQKSDSHRVASQEADTAPGCFSETSIGNVNLECPSSKTEGEPTSEVALSVTMESNNVEIRQDCILQHAVVAENTEVKNMEVDRSETELPEGDLTSEVVVSVTMKSDNVEILQDCALQPALVAENSEVKNMDLDPSETEVPSLKRSAIEYTPESGHTEPSNIQDEPCVLVEPPQLVENSENNAEPSFKESLEADNVNNCSRDVPSLSGMTEPTLKDSVDEVEPSLKESSKSSDLDSGKPEGSTVSINPGGLNNVPSVTSTVSLATEHSGVVNSMTVSFEKSDMVSTEANVVEGGEDKQNSSNLSASFGVGDMATGFNTTALCETPDVYLNLEGTSDRSEDKGEGDLVSQKALSINSDSSHVELVPEDGKALERPMAVEKSEDDCMVHMKRDSSEKEMLVSQKALPVNSEPTYVELVPQDVKALEKPTVVEKSELHGVVIHMEMDSPNKEMLLKDIAVECSNIELVPHDDAGKRLSQGVEGTESGDVKVCDIEIKPSDLQASFPTMLPPEETATSVSNTSDGKNTQDDAEKRLSQGAEDTESDHVKVCDIKVKPSEPQASLLTMLPPEEIATSVSNTSDGKNTQDDAGKRLSQVIEGSESDDVKVYDVKVKPSEPQAYLPTMLPPEETATSDGKNIKQSGSEADAEESERSLTTVLTPVSETVALKLECTAGSENVKDSLQLCCEKSIAEDDMEVDRAGEEKHSPTQIPRSPDGLEVVEGDRSNVDVSLLGAHGFSSKGICTESSIIHDVPEHHSQRLQAVEGPSYHVKVCNIERNLTEVDASLQKPGDCDNTVLAHNEHVGQCLPLEVEKSEVNMVEVRHVELSLSEVEPSSSIAVNVESANREVTRDDEGRTDHVSEDYNDTQEQQMVEHDELCNVESNPSEVSKAFPVESANMELTQLDQGRIDIQSKDHTGMQEQPMIENDEVCNVESNPSDAGPSSSEAKTIESAGNLTCDDQGRVELQSEYDAGRREPQTVENNDGCNVESSEVKTVESAIKDLTHDDQDTADDQSEHDTGTQEQPMLKKNEACYVESDPSEAGGSSSEVITVGSAITEINLHEKGKMELHCEDHTGTIKQRVVGSNDSCNVETDPAQTKVSSPELEEN